MVAQRIQGNYDCLEETMRVFMRHADMTVALTFQVEGLVDQLQGGAWRGVGAEAFYVEMGELILPAMRKLEDALQFAGEGTGKIHTILREAEEEAARLFRGEDNSVVIVSEAPPNEKDENTNLEALDRLTPPQAMLLVADLNKRIGEFSAYVDKVANEWLVTLRTIFVVGELLGVTTTEDNLLNLLVSSHFAKKAKDLLTGVTSWFAALYVGTEAGKAIIEFFENLITTGNPIGMNDGRDTVPERAHVKAAKLAALFAAEQIGLKAIQFHILLQQIANEVKASLAANPNAVMSGTIITKENGEIVVIITADGAEIFKSATTSEVATFIDEIFDHFGSNFTSQKSLQQGVAAYMQSHWAGGVGISETIERAMRDPDMQILLGRIKRGESITPAEVEHILSRYPIVMPMVIPTPHPKR